jgi:uncharacterized protein YqgC (DUF456 family)
VNLALEILVGVAVVIGLIGIVIAVIPGSLVIGAAVLVWALVTETSFAWWTFAVVAVVLVAGMVASKVVTARHTQRAGTANGSLIFAGLLGIVGFFVIPLVGLVIGFMLGLWLAEFYRLRNATGAWASAKAGLKGTGWGMLTELAAGLIAGIVWLAAAIYT